VYIQRKRQFGFTLIELVVATTILLVLSGLIIPVARVQIKREKEHRLREALWEMRDAIDRYKDNADRAAFRIKVNSFGYPPDLDTLVNGEDVGGKKLRFLRRIPTDPMMGNTDWGLRCRMTRILTHGTARTSLTSIRSHKAPRSTAPSTRTGK